MKPLKTTRKKPLKKSTLPDISINVTIVPGKKPLKKKKQGCVQDQWDEFF